MNTKNELPHLLRRRRSCLPGLSFLLVAGLCAAGCADRTYLTKSHGRAYAEAFDRQAVAPTPRPATAHGDPIEGLDSQEAAAVSRSYRHSLSGKEGATDTTPQPMVITTNAAGQPTYMPPPSVPNQ
jgi:hypothetical protein